MTNKGNLFRISRGVDFSLRELNELKNRVSGVDSFIGAKRRTENEKIIIQAINNTGDMVYRFYCLKIVDPVDDALDPLRLPSVVKPSSSDDVESVIYGSVLNDMKDQGICLVQISGQTIFRLYASETPVKIGDLIYPISLSHLVANKEKSDRINIPLGRSLQSELGDSQTIMVMMNSSSSSEQNSFSVRVATTANIVLSGIQAIDGITIGVGNLVLVKNQTDGSQNGIWEVSASDWIQKQKMSVLTYKSISVVEGTENGRLNFVYDGANVLPMGAVYL